MRCEVWEAKGTNCEGGEKCQENERAAGSFIVNSFSTIHSVSPTLRHTPNPSSWDEKLRASCLLDQLEPGAGRRRRTNLHQL